MKRLILTLAASFAGVVLAAPSSYWAAAYTEAASADASEGGQTDYYSGYYCSVDMANTLFGGKTVEALTAYFTDNFATGVQLLETESANYAGAGSVGKLGLSLKDYDHGQYALNTTYGNSLSAFGSAYLAVLLYDNTLVREFRVMSDDPTERLNGNAYFTDGDPTATGEAGSWTTVPEPTSGLMILLGMAGLALRRKPRA